MELTPERKERINKMGYDQLLNTWWFAPVGDPWFQGETGNYWRQRMRELRSLQNRESMHTDASKAE